MGEYLFQIPGMLRSSNYLKLNHIGNDHDQLVLQGQYLSGLQVFLLLLLLQLQLYQASICLM